MVKKPGKSAFENLAAMGAFPYSLPYKKEQNTHAEKNRADVVSRGQGKPYEPWNLIKICGKAIKTHQSATEENEENA
jgi:hypothetical protein